MREGTRSAVRDGSTWTVRDGGGTSERVCGSEDVLFSAPGASVMFGGAGVSGSFVQLGNGANPGKHALQSKRGSYGWGHVLQVVPSHLFLQKQVHGVPSDGPPVTRSA